MWAGAGGSALGDLDAGDLALAGNEELILGMLPGKGDKFVHIGLDGGHGALHSGNGIRLSLKADTLKVDTVAVEAPPEPEPGKKLSEPSTQTVLPREHRRPPREIREEVLEETEEVAVEEIEAR